MSVYFTDPSTGEWTELGRIPGRATLELGEHGLVLRIIPAEERRGGADPDWDRAKPGEELPVKPEPETWDGLDE